jgi:hypothetical protein
MVKPHDVLYVPRTYIRDINIFMDQYLGAVSQFKAFFESFFPGSLTKQK